MVRRRENPSNRPFWKRGATTIMNFLQVAKTFWMPTRAEMRPDNQPLISQILLCHISKLTPMMVYQRRTPPFSSVFKVLLVSEASIKTLQLSGLTKNRKISEMVDNLWPRRHRPTRFKISLMRIRKLVVHLPRVMVPCAKNLAWTHRKSRTTMLASEISFSKKSNKIILVELTCIIVVWASLLP